MVVIRNRSQSGSSHRLQYAEIRKKKKKRAASLRNHNPAFGQLTFRQLIKFPGVQSRQLDGFRVGQIDNNHIENFPGLLQKCVCVLVANVHPGIAERILVELAKNRVILAEFRHRRIEIDQRNFFDVGIFEDFPRCQPVAAAENQHIFMRNARQHCRMHQRLVIAVFVVAAKLFISIEIQPVIIFELSDYNSLIGRLLLINNFIHILLLLAIQHNRLRRNGQCAEQGGHDQKSGSECFRKFQRIAMLPK